MKRLLMLAGIEACLDQAGFNRSHSQELDEFTDAELEILLASCRRWLGAQVGAA